MKYYIFFYILLFLVLLSYPHFLAGHISIISNLPFVETIINFIIILLGIIIYFFHERQISRMLKKNRKYKKKLIDSYKYNGTVNSSIDLIEELILFINKSKKKKFKDLDLINKLKYIVKKLRSV